MNTQKCWDLQNYFKVHFKNFGNYNSRTWKCLLTWGYPFWELWQQVVDRKHCWGPRPVVYPHYDSQRKVTKMQRRSPLRAAADSHSNPEKHHVTHLSPLVSRSHPQHLLMTYAWKVQDNVFKFNLYRGQKRSLQKVVHISSFRGRIDPHAQKQQTGDFSLSWKMKLSPTPRN